MGSKNQRFSRTPRPLPPSCAHEDPHEGVIAYSAALNVFA